MNDSIPVTVNLPTWMAAALIERAGAIGVEPEVIIRVLLGDHLAAATQAHLPVRLGA